MYFISYIHLLRTQLEKRIITFRIADEKVNGTIHRQWLGKLDDLANLDRVTCHWKAWSEEARGIEKHTYTGQVTRPLAVVMLTFPP